MWILKTVRKISAHKNCAQNVGEIDSTIVSCVESASALQAKKLVHWERTQILGEVVKTKSHKVFI